MDSLKKCPFCDGVAIENNDNCGHWIECDICGCRTGSTSYHSNEHVLEWNKRRGESGE